MLWDPPGGRGYVATGPTCGPLRILPPALKRWEPPGGRGYVATRPTCGPLLILSPALRVVDPLKVKGKKALPSAPPVDPPASKRHTRRAIPSETTPLGVGDWLTDKDILRWLNQELYHVEIDEPHAWTLAVLFIIDKRLSKCMRIVESGTTMDNMAWRRRHIFMVKRVHWFVCAFNCRVRLELFIIWVWEPLSSIHLIHPFLMAMKKLSLTTKHRALGF